MSNSEQPRPWAKRMRNLPYVGGRVQRMKLGMKTINTNELKQMRQRGDVHVINVLAEEHFRDQHIPGSLNVPVESGDFTQRVEEIIGGKDKPVIVYCANQQCDASPTAAKKLDQAGFTDVYDYEIGVEGWKQAGEPIETGAAGARR